MSHNGSPNGNHDTATVTPPAGTPRKNLDAIPENTSITRDQFPGSAKIYIDGAQPAVKVPVREIQLKPTRRIDGTQVDNGSIRVYDTSGPYTDPNIA